MKKSDARTRILETAEKLFYAEGVRAVGIDRIVAEAGVAKMSLYNHFSSKDELILAVLQHREEQFGVEFQAGMQMHVEQGMTRLRAFFAALKEWFGSPGFRGCMFINSRVELADARHPASEFAAAHKQRFHALVKELVVEAAGSKVADTIAPAIALLVEGAILTAVMEQSAEPADVAQRATMALMTKVGKK